MSAPFGAPQLSGPEPQPDSSFRFGFSFPAWHPVFAGHFPGHPLLPGIFQIELARAAGERLRQRPLRIQEVVRAKFNRPVGPDDSVQLRLKCTPDGEDLLVHARFSVGGQPVGETILRCAEMEMV